jgi:GT2 family glycosyltransferase
MSDPRVSVGIPLYCSRPFLDSLRENCAALAAETNIEVIISDRHGLDDAFDLLYAEWGKDARFRFLRGDDRLNWVENMNLLLREARGEYFRWMPHDDCFPAGCLTPLITRLESSPSVVLAYGPTRALDAAGRRRPERDRLRSFPVRPGQAWTLQHSLDLFWKGSCDGAFKGLFRRRAVLDAKLFIRPTYRLIHAERAWLFGLSLLGGLAEEPKSIYLKRFHPNSVHATWRRGTLEIISATSTMCGYLRDYGPDLSAKCLGAAYLWRKAFQRIKRQRGNLKGRRHANAAR